jgi:hypothetical protein
MSSDVDEDFEPLVVLQLSPTIPDATKKWVINRLTASHDDDEGAGLLARFEPTPENQVNSLLSVLQKINLFRIILLSLVLHFIVY